MSLNWSEHPSDFAKRLQQAAAEMATEGAERMYAAGLARITREHGLTSTDGIELRATVTGDPGGELIHVDEARVRALAEQMLAEEPPTD